MWLHREATSFIMYQLSTILLPCTELSLSLLATLCIEVLQLQFQVTNPLKLKSLDWRALPLTRFLKYSSYVLLFVELRNCFVGVDIPILLATVCLGVKIASEGATRLPVHNYRLGFDGNLAQLRNHKNDASRNRIWLWGNLEHHHKVTPTVIAAN